MTQNGTTDDKKGRLMNGTIHTVGAFDRRGNIVLGNGQVVPKRFGHITHGYCTTSHASQGKTVDRVFVALGPESFAAASKEQFYVSVSRGREAVTVYCQDRRDLLEAVSRSSARLSASELAATPAVKLQTAPSRLVRLTEHMRRVARATFARQRSEPRDTVRPRDIVPEKKRERGLER